MIYALIICVGVMWAGQCEQTIIRDYPTQLDCEAAKKKVTAVLRDGYANCVLKETKPATGDK
jgi:hypothetical protein